MSQPAPAPEKVRTWLRRELIREARSGAILLAAAILAVLVTDRAWPGFGAYWDRLNYQLARTALNQHPFALARTFGGRIGDNEYGWRPLAWSAPFNVTVARDELREDYPEIIGVFDGSPVVTREATLRRIDSGRFSARIAAFMDRYRAIESGRFSWLYGEEDAFSVPDPTRTLGQLATKVLGLPDAFMHTIGRIVAGGMASILHFCTVLALAGVAAWEARRPARRWLKLVAWPVLASVLVWFAIIPMALAAALLGRLTPNTSVFALVASLPLLLVVAKFPFRFAENLLLRVPPGSSPAAIIKALTRPPFPTK